MYVCVVHVVRGVFVNLCVFVCVCVCLCMYVRACVSMYDLCVVLHVCFY